MEKGKKMAIIIVNGLVFSSLCLGGKFSALEGLSRLFMSAESCYLTLGVLHHVFPVGDKEGVEIIVQKAPYLPLRLLHVEAVSLGRRVQVTLLVPENGVPRDDGLL